MRQVSGVWVPLPPVFGTSGAASRFMSVTRVRVSVMAQHDTTEEVAEMLSEAAALLRDGEGAREGDSASEESNDNQAVCGHETNSGGECSRSVDSPDDRCFQHQDGDNESDTSDSNDDPLPDTVERRLGLNSRAVTDLSHNIVSSTVHDWVNRHDTSLFDGVNYSPAPNDDVLTSAAKAVAREKTGESYPDELKAVFGECADPSCERWSNGYEAKTCAKSSCTPDSEATDDDVAEAVEEQESDTSDTPDTNAPEGSGEVQAAVEIDGAKIELSGTPDEIQETIEKLTQ